MKIYEYIELLNMVTSDFLIPNEEISYTNKEPVLSTDILEEDLLAQSVNLTGDIDLESESNLAF